MDQNTTPTEPQAPAPEPTTTPTQPPQAPQANAPYPQSSSKTGLIVGIIAGVVVLGGVLAAILMMTMGGISKKDYQSYTKALDTVSDEYRTTSSKVSPYLSAVLSGRDANISSSEAKDFMAKYSTAVDALPKEKASKDEDIKKAYDTFKTKNDSFLKFVDSIIAAESQFGKASDNCSADKAKGITISDPNTLVSSYDTALGPCITSLDDLAKVDNKEIADYAKKMAETYRAQRALMVEFANAQKSGDSATVSAVQSKIGKQASDFTSVARDFTTSFRDATKNYEVKDELNALIKLSTEKANKK